MPSSGKPLHRGQVLLLAAAEAVLGETETVQRRVTAILELDRPVLLDLAKTVARYITSSLLARGSDWTTRPDDDTDLDERVPPARALTLRILAARSAEDHPMVDALLSTVPDDPAGRSETLRDLFAYAFEWTERKSTEISNPSALIPTMHRAITQTTDSLGW
ncbi:hypothetical protein [Actinocorallia libanotica]|uniref:Uncharacterized protein n=1 Tax=Actinocorallia libanotica TaxID=46162 RepID=A0ABN1RVU2_9ACTN